MHNKILAFDLGGTYIKYGVVTNKGEILQSDRKKTPKTYEELLKLINEIKGEVNLEISDICISSPCNYYNGALRGGSHIKYIVNKDIVTDLKNLYDINVLIENDGNCAVLCEHWVGNGSDVSSIVCLVIGTGLGGGVIIDNRLLKGKHNMAGDIGYMLTEIAIKRNGATTALGTYGATGMVTREAMNIDNKITRAEDLFETKLNDEKLIKLRSDMIKTLANGIINCLYIFDTEKILIGGEISKCKPFVEILQNEINSIIDLLNGYEYYPKVEVTKFNNQSNLIGASSLYFNPIQSL